MSLRNGLAFLAVVQLGLAAITWWPAGDGAGPVPFLEVEREDITEIEVAGSSAGEEAAVPVVVARSGDSWVVRSASDYPARPEKIEELLGLLQGLDAGERVAQQSASHNALKVGEGEYGRRIVVRTGEGQTSFRLGAATSKSVNLRREEEDDVYRSQSASEWAFSDTASSYYDPLYVSATPTEITALTVHNEHGTLEFERREDRLTLMDLAEGEVADLDAIDQLVNSLTKLRMTGPVGQQIEAAFGLGDAAAASAGGARVDWTIAAEDQSVGGGYQIGATIESDRYAKAVDSPFVVRVLESATTRLRNAERSEFLAGDAPSE